MRMVLVLVSTFFLACWIVYGFDSVIQNLDNPNNPYGVGIHYSTLHGMVLVAYVSIINLQVGGLKSLGELKNEVVFDFKCVFAFINRNALKMRELHAGKHYVYHPLIDFLYSVALAVLGLFVFEYPYVFMLNHYHYGDLFYPVYVYLNGATFIRNTIGLLLPLFYCLFITRFIYRARLRINRIFLILGLTTALLFVAWVAVPGAQPYRTPEDISLEIEPLTWPSQKFFPQNVYTYLNVSDGYHELKNIRGWHQEDNLIHLVNVVAKYMVFISVGYLFSVKDEKST